MFTRAIVRPPAPNFSQGLTTVFLGAPDYKVALWQHEAYCAVLEACGLTLMKLEADERYPDSCFVEDTAIVTERVQVLTRPGAPSREGEVETMRGALAECFSSVPEIRPPGTLDGGDICEAGDHFFIGLSRRTNLAGAQQLTETLAKLGYTSTIVDITKAAGALHLKSAIAYLGDNRLVVTEGMSGRGDFAGYDLVKVDRGEEYAANCIRVNDHVLIAKGFSNFAKKLRELDYQTIALDMSEFQKMDGGLSCLSVRF
jgi:dimethylargininase